MNLRKLGKTDLEVSVIGFGGIPIQRLSIKESEKVLLHALDRGINFFDTARGYTDSEDKMGRALSGHRDKIILASKALSRGAGGMRRELETSLRKLRTSFIDLYQCHSVGSMEELDKLISGRGAYRALEKARQEGKIRWTGFTSHSREVTMKALETDLFDTIQIPFSIIENDWKKDVIPLAGEKGTGVIGMKPIAGGAIQNASASLRYIVTEGVDVAIPGMDTVTQVDQNASVGREEPAPPTESEMGELLKEKEQWGEKFCRRCGYCMPCPEGLKIPFLFIIQGYYSRYGLQAWALQRLNKLDKSYSDCTACGECLEKCPYQLPIPDMMEQFAEEME